MKLTNAIRDHILHAALTNVPRADYLSQLHPIIQEKVFELSPPEVRVLGTSETGRPFLFSNAVEITLDSNTCELGDRVYGIGALWGRNDYYRYVKIRLDERIVNFLNEDAPERILAQTIIDTGLFTKHIEQARLLVPVRDRLKATLQTATTTNALRRILEPELHHLIPADTPTARLPALAAPVVDDLRRLGAVLPEVPTNKDTTNAAQ